MRKFHLHRFIFLAVLLMAGRPQFLRAQCNGISSDMSACIGETVTMSAFGFTPGIGPYTYNWGGIPFLNGQGTPQVQFVANGGNPTTIVCTRHDIGMNCTASTIVAVHNTGPLYIYPINPPLPSCPDTNQIDTFSVEWTTWAQNGIGSDVTYQPVGGTILSQFRTPNGSMAYYDTLVVQWDGFGTHGIHTVLEVQGTGWFSGYCYFPGGFWPIGGGVNISGPTDGCDTSGVHTYNATNTVGYAYNWSIVNGTILSGQGTASVTVRWHGSGTISVDKMATSCTSVYTDTQSFIVHSGSFSLGSDRVKCSDDTITLSGPLNQAQYIWSNGSTLPMTDVANAGTYSLQVMDGWGCWMADTVEVFTADCVFPGDANDDGVADNQDILSIAAYVGRTGPFRSLQNLNWMGQLSTDWGNPLPGTADAKHSDCDGNGTVLAADTLGVTLNYGQTHTKTGGVTGGGTALRVVALQDTVIPGNIAWFAVELGDAQDAVDSLLGLAFTVHYSTAGVDSAGLLQVDYGNCWFAGAGSRMDFTRNLWPAAEADIAVARNDQAEQTGHGEVCRIAIRTDSNLVPQEALLAVWLDNVHVVNGALEPMGVDVFGDSTLVTAEVAVGNDPAMASLWAIAPLMYPNPASESVNVEVRAGKVMGVEVFDLTGKSILVRQGGRPLLVVPTTALPAGVYGMRIVTDKGSFMRRLAVQRD
jgi:hypothetical protein